MTQRALKEERKQILSTSSACNDFAINNKYRTSRRGSALCSVCAESRRRL